MTEKLPSNVILSLDTDEPAKLERLKEWINLVKTRPRRAAFCDVLTRLMDRGAVHYGRCQTEHKEEQGFTIIVDEDVQEVLRSSHSNDPVAAAIMEALVYRWILLETGYSEGEPDLIFKSLIHRAADQQKMN